MKKKKPKQLGTRYNKGKLRWRNFPMFLMRPLAEVGHAAEKHPDNPKGKYETFNFLNGLSVLDNMDAMMRHYDKFIDPSQSDYDEETQLHHLACVAWNALVALYFINTRPELDDRYKNQVISTIKRKKHVTRNNKV